MDWILSFFVSLDDQIARISRMKASIFFVIRARSGPRFCSRQIPLTNVTIKPALLAVATIRHDLGLTDRYTAENRFEVDGANAARSFLKGRGISTQQMQVVWDAIALHTTRSIALHKEPEVAMTHSGITVDVLGAGLDRIPQDKQGAILAEFPRLALKNRFKDCLCNIVRRKPATTFDNIVRDFGVRYVEGYTSPNFADVVANAPFSE